MKILSLATPVVVATSTVFTINLEINVLTSFAGCIQRVLADLGHI